LEYRQKEYAKVNKKVGCIVSQAEFTKLKKLDEYVWLNEAGSPNLFSGWAVHRMLMAALAYHIIFF